MSPANRFTIPRRRSIWIWRRWLMLAALGLAGLFAASNPNLQAADPPNILVILVDDLGYGDLSSYGATDLQSPRLDRLVDSGMKFKQFYANCPVCSPTRAALLSGRYPDLVGVPGVIRTHSENNWGYLDPSAVLLPHVLKRAGYHTAIVGKWHLGLESPNTPTERGFDFFHGFLGDMMDDYYNHRRHGNNYMRLNREVIQPTGHATDLFTDWAIDYLDDCREQNRRFFLYLAYNAPHTPVQPPEDWLQKVKDREQGIPDRRAKLVALIEHLDHGIGRVIDRLQSNGQADNTLVVFTSDNGGQLNVGGQCGPFRGGKQDMYEGGLKVPFCAVWPKRIPAGSTSDFLALTMDLFPTLCAAAGVAAPEHIEGRSFWRVLQGEEIQPSDRTHIWVRRERGRQYQGQDYYAARQGPWKLVQNHPFEPYQLYNLQDDPMETRNLIREKPDIAESLNRTLQLHFQAAGAVPWQKPSMP